MEVRKIQVSRLNPALYNPRRDLQPGDPEYQSLCRAIDEFGYVDPVVWNEQTGNVVGGHQRLKVLIERGETEIDVSVVHLPQAKEKALNIALNKISGAWDDEKLRSVLLELSDLPEFDAGTIGFADGLDLYLIDADALPAQRIANAELIQEDYAREQFSCQCPRCGFLFGGDA